MTLRSAAAPLVLVLAALAPLPALAAARPDKPGCTDHPLFPTRMPNYRIEQCESKEFGSWAFPVGRGKKETREGALTALTYAVDDRKDDPSGLAVVRNYENALQAVGGKVVASDPERWLTGSVLAGGREAWVTVEKGNGKIWIHVVEAAGMTQHVTANAAFLRDGLASSGHVAVEGIYFDTGKATLKPESTPALLEVKKLLDADPSLALWVVGHTDTVGTVESNMALAQARAEAVVKALTTTHGVAASRLRGYGVGPLAPVASNATEAGRAKNRRVEIVKQ